MNETTRRGFLRAATGAAAAAGATGTAAGQEGEQPEWGGWLSGVEGGYEDVRGESEVVVEVGAQGNGGSFAFSPAGIWVDPGTTVVWEWTGEGGGHNVVAQDGPAGLDSDTYNEAGDHYQYTFEEADAGITNYLCEPHRDLNMYGAVAVGGDVPTTGGGGEGGGGGGPSLPDEAKTLGVASTGGLVAVLGLAYVFMKYAAGSREVE